MSYNTTFESYGELIKYLQKVSNPQCFTINYLPETDEYSLDIGNQPYETYEQIIDDLQGQISWYIHWGSEQQKEIQELRDKISFKETTMIATNSLIREQSKKVKHLFPLENVAGYGQLCDKVLLFEETLKKIIKYYDHEDTGELDVYVYACVKESLGE